MHRFTADSLCWELDLTLPCWHEKSTAASVSLTLAQSLLPPRTKASFQSCSSTTVPQNPTSRLVGCQHPSLFKLSLVFRSTLRNKAKQEALQPLHN